MKDERVRYRTVERETLLAYGVRASCLTSGDLKAVRMADQFVNAIGEISEACTEAGPFLYVVSRAGLRRVVL